MARAIGLIRYMTQKQAAAPPIEAHHGTFQAGRKEGSPASRSTPATRFTTPYVVRKNIVSAGATASRLPSATPVSATARVIRSGTPGPEMRPIERPTTPGNTRSSAIACRVRGAPSTEPTADEKMAPVMPAKTRKATPPARRNQMRLSMISASRPAAAPSTRTAPR